MSYDSLKYVCVRRSWFIVNYPEHTHLQTRNLIKFGQDTAAGSISRVKMGCSVVGVDGGGGEHLSFAYMSKVLHCVYCPSNKNNATLVA